LPGPEVAAWFRTIEKACAKMFPVKTTDWTVPTPMSKLTEGWIFQDVREYEMPYEKRCYSTNWSADQLAASGWARWAADRIDVIQSQGSGKLGLDPRRNKTGCKLSVQIQNFGGAKSKFFENGIRNKDLTAYRYIYRI
jgi:hypothetical protein